MQYKIASTMQNKTVSTSACHFKTKKRAVPNLSEGRKNNVQHAHRNPKGFNSFTPSALEIKVKLEFLLVKH